MKKYLYIVTSIYPGIPSHVNGQKLHEKKPQAYLMGSVPLTHPYSQNCTMVLVWKELLEIILPQPPCHGQGHLPLDQVAQISIQPRLEPFWGWDIYSFSGQPVPVPHHPHHKKFLKSNVNYPLLV